MIHLLAQGCQQLLQDEAGTTNTDLVDDVLTALMQLQHMISNTCNSSSMYLLLTQLCRNKGACTSLLLLAVCSAAGATSVTAVVTTRWLESECKLVTSMYNVMLSLRCIEASPCLTCSPECCCSLQVRSCQLMMLLNINTVEAWMFRHTPGTAGHELTH